MSLKAKNLKSGILNAGKKLGILVQEKSTLDEFITDSTKATAHLVNTGEKQAKRLAKTAGTKLDGLRAKIHEATAPKPAAPKRAPRAK
jgi:hypothetical protein